MTKLRVLIVEDSLTVRKHLVAVCAGDPDIEVVDDVDNGRLAIERCQSLRPDVITLDMMLPVMTGVAATEYIMAYCPTPILIVSASVNRGELFKTYDALAAGAVDVLDKPTGNEIDDAWERRFLSTLKLVSRIKVITHPRAKLSGVSRLASTSVPPEPLATAIEPRPRAVAIGISTGGPAALVTIFRGLPADYPLPILLVIHIGRIFASSLADWLDGQSSLRVRHANDGESLSAIGAGQVVMAPADVHLEVQNGRLRLSHGPERHSCRPSVDVLFESVARELGTNAIGCLLTGMGRDGAGGLCAIRNAGGRTLAQDEQSSIVFGMPREAILLGGAEKVLPLEGFAPALIKLAKHGKAELP